MTEEVKNKGYPNLHPQPPPPTFQGVATYPPPPPPATAAGYPPPAAGAYHPPPQPEYYPKPVPGYAVEEGRPAVARRHHCCGCGLGWVLFGIGFALGTIPWYIGTILLLFRRHKMDGREKPGYIACAIAAVIATILIIIGASTGAIYR